MTAISYGSFNLNDNVNYFVIGKPIEMVKIAPTMFKIGRLAGVKKTGEVVNEKQISLNIRILGSSRTDLENKIDAMAQALNLRSQNLTMHTNDSRYWIADCLGFSAQLQAGKILSTTATVNFIAYQPYAFAVSGSTNDTNNQLMTYSGSGTQYTYSYSITGGGNVYAYPTFTVYQRTAAMSTTLSSALSSGTNYTSISVAATSRALTTRDTVILTSGGHTQSVTLSANASSGATTLSVNSFNANFSYPSSTTTVVLDATMTYVQVTQTVDSQVFFANSSLPAVAGDYLTINCDPTNNTNGFTAILNGGTTLSNVGGQFPVLEPVSTGLTWTINCNSNPTFEVVTTWVSRWLS